MEVSSNFTEISPMGAAVVRADWRTRRS